MVRRLTLALLLVCASAARAAPDAQSTIKTYGYFQYNQGTLTQWPTKLNFPWLIGGMMETGTYVTQVHNAALAAGNTRQVVLYNIGFGALDTTGPNQDSTFWDTFHTAHPEYQLRSSDGRGCFTNDGNGTEVAAMDVGNLGYVDLWTSYLINTIHATRGYDGVRADYVFRLSNWALSVWKDSLGNSCVPYKGGVAYTLTQYRTDLLAALRRVTAAFHAQGMVFLGNHGGAWNDNCDGSHDFANDANLQNQLATMDATQLEFCLYHDNAVLQTTGSGLPADHQPCAIDVIKYLAYGNAHGTAMLCEGYGGAMSDANKNSYVMATALLTSTGESAVGEINNTADWGTNYEIKLGPPVPCYWPTLQTHRVADVDDECIDGSGNVTPCPGVAYRRRADRREECVDASGNVVTRGCEGSRLTRRRHFDNVPTCINSAGTVTPPPVPFECLDSNQNIVTSTCPGTGRTYRREFKYGAVIVNPTVEERTIHFGGDPTSGWNGPSMDDCTTGGGGLAETFAGPAGKVCWHGTTTTGATTTSTTTTVTTTTTLSGMVGLGLVENYGLTCDSNLTPYPYLLKSRVVENFVSGTTVNTSYYQTTINDEAACGQMEVPLGGMALADGGLPAWGGPGGVGVPADLNTIYQNLMRADPNYVASGAWTPKVPYSEWGLEENIHGGCCSDAQTNSSSNLYAKLSALQNAKGAVNGGEKFKIGYQITNTDSGALSAIDTFLHSASATKIDFLALHPYPWNNWPDPDSWLPSYMDSVDSYKAASGHTAMPVWFTEVGLAIVSPVTEAYAARYVGKMTTLALARGVAEVIWYHYWDDPNQGTCPSGAECNFGLINRLGTPMQGYTTWRLLNQYLYGKSYVGMTTLGSGYVKVYRFTGGGTTAMIAWVWDPNFVVGVVNINTSQLPVVPTTIVNYQGQTITPVNGNFDVGRDPVFMHN